MPEADASDVIDPPGVRSLDSEGNVVEPQAAHKRQIPMVLLVAVFTVLLVIVGIILGVVLHGTPDDDNQESCTSWPCFRVVDIVGVGKVNGSVINTTAFGQPCDVTEFLNIPYAQAPLGKNRFLPPLRREPWEGVHDSTKHGLACTQLDGTTHKLASFSGEDCLHVNIWTVHAGTTKSPKPVYFFIHGGAFNSGSGGGFNGTSLSSLKDISGNMKSDGLVVVTFNYRLGPLGYLHSNDIYNATVHRDGKDGAALGGMNGLLDQLMALQWVYDHIADFGGDPHRITLGGQSAGAQSACMHMHSPLSKGLFQQVILESGECTSSWGPTYYNKGALALSQKYMDNVTSESVPELGSNLAALQKLSLADLTKSYDTWNLIMNPTVDGLFLKAHPKDLPIHEGLSAIIGSNEFDGMGAPPVGDPSQPMPWPVFSGQFEQNMTSAFGKDGVEIAEKYPLIDAIPGQDPKDPYANAQTLRYLRATSDTETACPALWFARKIVESKGHVYLYRYNYNDGDVSDQSFGLMSNTSWPYAGHGTEITYAMGLPWDASAWTPTPAQLAALTPVYNVMQAYWSSFIEAGRPAITGAATVAWPKFELSPVKYAHLHLNVKQQQRVGYLKDICDFWDTYRSRGCREYSNFQNFGFGGPSNWWPPLPPCEPNSSSSII